MTTPKPHVWSYSVFLSKFASKNYYAVSISEKEAKANIQAQLEQDADLTSLDKDKILADIDIATLEIYKDCFYTN